MVRAIGLYGALFGVWLLLSGFFTPFFLGLAVVCCALVVAIALRMDAVDREPLAITLGWRFPAYLAWLAWQIVLANLDVARRVWSPSLPIDPQLEWVPTSQRSDLGTMIYANSITLTPGNVSVSIEPGRILVHALTREGISDLVDGPMDARVRGVEGRIEAG